MGSASNFAFLGVYDKRLVTLGGLAERYFRDDPSTAIVKLRQFAELTAKIIAARHGVYRDERETFEETLRRLAYDRIIPREVADIFHTMRKFGDVAVRTERSAPLVAELEEWMCGERAKLSRHAPVAQAIDYMLKRWEGFARFLHDGCVCLTNNAAERALRGLALGRKSWLFAGSERGADRAAVMYTLIGTAKLNDAEPQVWLADVLARISDTPQNQLSELLPGNWKAQSARLAA